MQENVRCSNSEGAFLYKNREIADYLNSYFVERFTREEVTNRMEGIFSTQIILANIYIEDNEVPVNYIN